MEREKKTQYTRCRNHSLEPVRDPARSHRCGLQAIEQRLRIDVGGLHQAHRGVDGGELREREREGKRGAGPNIRGATPLTSFTSRTKWLCAKFGGLSFTFSTRTSTDSLTLEAI